MFRFVEAHTHLLQSPSTMKHLTQSKDMNILHKKLIVDNSKMNYAPIKSFRMFKEYVNGYNNVGASLQDFKNFSRNIKKYLKEYDAQMLVESFMQKKIMCSSFYFDFEVDRDAKLDKLFWADHISIKNYGLFGDCISFDSTFGMNTYRMIFAPFTGVDNHGKCVTFAGGLIHKEDDKSYIWLFENFMKAMGGCFTKYIIIDQDLGMKSAIVHVFGDKVIHRLCMWHIMKKMPERVCEFRDTEFMKDLCSMIWKEDISCEEFEEQWVSMVNKYGADKNDWLISMYNMREQWIPCYFKDPFLGGLLKTPQDQKLKIASLNHSPIHIFL